MLLMNLQSPVSHVSPAPQPSPRLTPAQILDAKDWLCECTWPDTTEEKIRAKSDSCIEAAIARHYEGGIPAFIIDCIPVGA